MHSRFLFDAEFSRSHLHDADPDGLAVRERTDREQAEYERGFRDGSATANNAQDTKVIALLESISLSLNAIREDGHNRLREAEQHLVTIAADLARYFASELDPISVLTKPQFGLVDMLEKLGRDADLTLTLAPEDAALFRETHTASQFDMAVIIENSTFAKGQFEVGWPEGGMKFDKQRLDRAYSELLEQYQQN